MIYKSLVKVFFLNNYYIRIMNIENIRNKSNEECKTFTQIVVKFFLIKNFNKDMIYQVNIFEDSVL